jgi:hypothetical protein
MSFSGGLQLIFIILKLLNVITWPWLWVMAPLWISALIAFVVYGVAIIAYTRVGK